MIKKCIIGLISVSLIMPVVTFADFDENNNITITVDNFNITVTYSDDEDFDKATIMMKDGSNALIYMGEQKTTINKRKIDFAQFMVNDKLPTDTYTISVGVNGKIVTEQLLFKNPFDREKTFVDMISAPDKTVLRTKMQAAANEIDEFDYTKYSAYDEATQLQIAQGIYELGLINKYIPTDDSTQTQSNVEELIAEFNTYIAKAFEAADIMTAQSASAVTALIDGAQSLTFDKTYFSGQYVYDKDVISNSVLLYNFAQYSNINFDKLYEVFDGYCLLYVINNNDFTTAKAALDYYKNPDFMDIDYSYFNNLSLQQQSSVFDKLKSEKITDYTKIPERFLSISKEIAEEDNNGGGQSVSRPSGGGGISIGGILNAVQSEEDYEEDESETQETIHDNTPAFNDIQNVPWAHEAIEALKNIGAIDGDGTGNFNPNNSVKRNEFVKIIVTAFDYLDESDECDFIDVPKDDWSYPYIASAFKSGLVNGESDDFFGAQDSISREDAAVILYRLYTKTKQAPVSNATFEDSSYISYYAKEAVFAMAQLGIINGYDNMFYPKKELTRAECAKLIYEVYKILVG